MTYPNLIIAGAPKCGTSSLFRWLADHPQACGSSVKETFYLMDEGHPLLRAHAHYHEHGLAGYRRYFEHCPQHSKIIFEATTHYIYQQTALKILANLTPLPQIVFVLRKPADRVYSSYQYTKNNLSNLNKQITFTQFIKLIKNRTNDARFNDYARASAYVLKNDINYSQYVEYLSHWRERFGRERIHVLLFEEMKRDPRAFMKDFAARIGVDTDFYDTYAFPVKNETIHIEHQMLHRRARRFEGVVPPGALKDFIKSTYLKVQAGNRVLQKSPDDEMTLAALEREFQPFNQRLAKEFGLDLSAWDSNSTD